MSDNSNTAIYHEKQRKQLCLLHALNNLFQRKEFVQKELDEICEILDDHRWLNSHRSWIGLGNYDANILMCALKRRGLFVVWFDKRLPLERIKFDNVLAYIFNTPSSSFIPFMKNRHWYTVMRFNTYFYNLDSKLPNPERIDSFEMFCSKQLLLGNELLLVTTEENSENCIASPLLDTMRQNGNERVCLYCRKVCPDLNNFKKHLIYSHSETRYLQNVSMLKIDASDKTEYFMPKRQVSCEKVWAEQSVSKKESPVPILFTDPAHFDSQMNNIYVLQSVHAFISKPTKQ